MGTLSPDGMVPRLVTREGNMVDGTARSREGELASAEKNDGWVSRHKWTTYTPDGKITHEPLGLDTSCEPVSKKKAEE